MLLLIVDSVVALGLGMHDVNSHKYKCMCICVCTMLITEKPLQRPCSEKKKAKLVW